MVCSIGSEKEGESWSPSLLTIILTCTPEEQELLSLRCCISINADSTICEKHKLTYLKLFEVKQRKCCNPFRRHKKNITSGLTVVTLEETKYMKLEGHHIVPGTKLCKTCKTHINEKNKDNDSSEIDDNLDKDHCIDDSNRSIEEGIVRYGFSPIKKHARSINHRRSESKKKLIKAQDNLKQLSEAIAGETGGPFFFKRQKST